MIKLYYFTLTIEKLYVPLPYLPHMFSITSWLSCFSFAFLLIWLLQCRRRRLPCHSLLSWGISLCIGIHCCVFYIFCGVGQCTLDISQIQHVSSRSLLSIFGSSSVTRHNRCFPCLYCGYTVMGECVEMLWRS